MKARVGAVRNKRRVLSFQYGKNIDTNYALTPFFEESHLTDTDVRRADVPLLMAPQVKVVRCLSKIVSSRT